MKRNAVISAGIVTIGNSKGVRIPKTIREQIGLEDRVTMTVKGDALVIRPERMPRSGWEAALKEQAKTGRDELLMPDTLANQFDDDSWTW
jgi:antitoxin MazE